MRQKNKKDEIFSHVSLLGQELLNRWVLFHVRLNGETHIWNVTQFFLHHVFFQEYVFEEGNHG